MANQVDLALPAATSDDCDRAYRTIDGVSSSYVGAVRRPGTSAEVCGEGRGGKGDRDGGLEDEVVDLVVGSSIWRGRSKAEDAYGAVVAGGSEVFVGGIECDALDVALML
jgi:hypothetical protein